QQDGEPPFPQRQGKMWKTGRTGKLYGGWELSSMDGYELQQRIFIIARNLLFAGCS
ncbi:MAG: hypothetical protein ACI9MB_003535, partial [Verrucomicrobiales bacterium]